MRAINHALTGSIIGLAVGEPLLAVPLALASHFVMDAIPHHGRQPVIEWLRTKTFRLLIYGDALACAGLVMVLAVKHPAHWLLAAICAFTAAAPDFVSINFYRHVMAGQKWQPGLYTGLARRLQWFERPIGAVVEVAWFIAAVIILAPLLR